MLPVDAGQLHGLLEVGSELLQPVLRTGAQPNTVALVHVRHKADGRPPSQPRSSRQQQGAGGRCQHAVNRQAQLHQVVAKRL